MLTPDGVVKGRDSIPTNNIPISPFCQKLDESNSHLLIPVIALPVAPTDRPPRHLTSLFGTHPLADRHFGSQGCRSRSASIYREEEGDPRARPKYRPKRQERTDFGSPDSIRTT